MNRCTPLLVLMAALTMLFSACGVAPDAEADDASTTVVSTKSPAQPATQDSQRINPDEPSSELCNGKCCNWRCGNGFSTNDRSIACMDCNAYARGYCATRGGLVSAKWLDSCIW